MNKGCPHNLSMEQLPNIKGGINDLWVRSQRVCKLASAWKLISGLEQNGVGTNKVEALEIKRSWQREQKKGYKGSMKEFKAS